MSLKSWLKTVFPDRRRTPVEIVVSDDERYLLDAGDFTKEVTATGLTFLGDATGPNEDAYEDRIRDIYSKVLWQYPSVERAYLALVSHSGEEVMALCLECSGEHDMELVDTLAMIFKMRHSSGTLDIMFAQGKHLANLKSVCSPFYDRSTYRPL